MSTAEETLFSVMSYLKENNFTLTFIELQKESKLYFDLNYVESLVKTNNFLDLEGYLKSFLNLDECTQVIYFHLYVLWYNFKKSRNESSGDICQKLLFSPMFHQPIFQSFLQHLTSDSEILPSRFTPSNLMNLIKNYVTEYLCLTTKIIFPDIKIQFTPINTDQHSSQFVKTPSPSTPTPSSNVPTNSPPFISTPSPAPTSTSAPTPTPSTSVSHVKVDNASRTYDPRISPLDPRVNRLSSASDQTTPPKPTPANHQPSQPPQTSSSHMVPPSPPSQLPVVGHNPLINPSSIVSPPGTNHTPSPQISHQQTRQAPGPTQTGPQQIPISHQPPQLTHQNSDPYTHLNPEPYPHPPPHQNGTQATPSYYPSYYQPSYPPYYQHNYSYYNQTPAQPTSYAYDYNSPNPPPSNIHPAPVSVPQPPSPLKHPDPPSKKIGSSSLVRKHNHNNFISNHNNTNTNSSLASTHPHENSEIDMEIDKSFGGNEISDAYSPIKTVKLVRKASSFTA